MKRTLSAVVAATVAAGALAAPALASAHDYSNGYGGYGGYADNRYNDGRAYDDGYRTPCQTKKRSNSTTGALLGVLAGAALGSNIGGHGARTEGAVVGGLAGALIGSQIGLSQAHGSNACQQDGYYGQGGYRYGQGNYDPRVRAPRYDRRPYDRQYGYDQRGYGGGW